MKYLLNTENAVRTLAVACAFVMMPALASDSEKVREVDIQACFELEYDSDDMTSQTAYEIAECFSTLANSIVDNHTDEFIADSELWVWDDRNVLLHYADSWFSFAAFKGHPDAEKQLKSTRQSFK